MTTTAVPKINIHNPIFTSLDIEGNYCKSFAEGNRDTIIFNPKNSSLGKGTKRMGHLLHSLLYGKGI
ncbi:Hypothetical protein I595_1761 [Croceitalea dokdonensis DOKDO 023]|uniref:Uncharacterized protein n=1 Tax=Croceitalea dokdonensis DOKDO 023 TaxID=1300341 RepID=A0A0P7B207_9FLAO|nr:Hypothetical protein I595_1761 [Croceitalea dokdonensis DOKDO 023]